MLSGIRKKKNAGFTLVEMILVTLSLSIISLVGYLGFAPMIESWTRASEGISSRDQVSYALDRIFSDVNMLRSNLDVTKATPGVFKFADVNGNKIEYAQTGTDIVRNSIQLVTGVKSLTFSYWDVNNNYLKAPIVGGTPTDIWYIEVEIVMSTGTTFKERIHPRNL